MWEPINHFFSPPANARLNFIFTWQHDSQFHSRKFKSHLQIGHIVQHTCVLTRMLAHTFAVLATLGHELVPQV